jgi:hypothetical protein
MNYKKPTATTPVKVWLNKTHSAIVLTSIEGSASTRVSTVTNPLPHF